MRSNRNVAELPRVHANIKRHVTKRYEQRHPEIEDYEDDGDYVDCE